MSLVAISLSRIQVDPSRLLTVAWVSLCIGGVCAVIIAADIVGGRRQPMAIMNVVWPVTALYGGILALAAYFALGRAKARARDQHPAPHHSDKKMWRASIIGSTHCGAGCTLGDVIAEMSLVAAGAVGILGSTLVTSYVFDFIAAYVLGVIFQYFAIAPMRHLSPAQGIWAALKADTLSLIAFQVGMYVWMAVVQLLLFQHALDARSPVYWFMMQIGMLLGFVTTYPMNWLLIRRHIKEAM